MDEDGTAEVLMSDRMGHRVPGIRGVYSHITDRMRTELVAGLQRRWEHRWPNGSRFVRPLR
jgi:hypothetical protein